MQIVKKRAALFISNTADFSAKEIIRDRERHFTMTRGCFTPRTQSNRTHVADKGTAKYMKYKLAQLQKETKPQPESRTSKIL